MRLAAIAAGLIALLATPGLIAQSNRSLTDSEPRYLLAQGVAISVPDDDRGSDDVQALQERIILLRSTVKSLTESLGIANSEAEMFKRQSADLASKIEALGLASVEKDQGKIEQRLLAAVRDLRLLKKQNEDAVNQLVRLTEAVQLLIKSSDSLDPQVRLNVETELRKAGQILGTPAAAKAGAGDDLTLDDAVVVDVQDKLSLVVANVGERQQVRIGMPFQVWRGDQLIGDVRVVDVRERICGAIVQNLKSEKESVKVGDRLKVDARQ